MGELCRMNLFRSRKLGIAFGGGAARGFAHIGVIKVLDEYGIRPDYIAGTSIGSVIGALYAAGNSWQEIREKTSKIKWKDLVKVVFPKKGLVKTARFEQMANELLGGKHFQDLEIPFAAVTVDIATSQVYVINDGPVAPAVRASSSIPGIFEPVEYRGRVLVDGGLINGVPADVVRDMGADLVVSVDLNGDLGQRRAPGNLLDIMLHSFMLMVRNNSQLGEEFSDFLLRPNLRDCSYYNLAQVDRCIALGEESAREVIGKIEKKYHGFLRKHA